MARPRLLTAALRSYYLWRLNANLKAKLRLLEARERVLLNSKLGRCLVIHGGLTLVWARVEAAIDHINELAFFNGGKDAGLKTIPQNLRWKRDYLQSAHKKLEWLHPLREGAEKLNREIERLGNERHNLVHGAIELIDETEILNIVRHEYGPEGLVKVETSLSVDALHDLAPQIVALLHALEDHLAAMNGALLKHGRQYLGGQAAQ